jgi:UDPglucose 6-dehydrogenase
MKVTVIGVGYVGLSTGACLAEMGNHVVCLDIDERRIAMLERGEVPLYEPGLKELIERNVAGGRLEFTCHAARAVHHGSVLFVAVGTPPGADGEPDLSQVLEAARQVGRFMTDYKVVANKSTVPVGTAERVREAIREELQQRRVQLRFAVVSNPEFLKEGAAIDDFMRPERVIVGSDDQEASLTMEALYAPFMRQRDRMMLMDVRSAEFTKYAANAMLATRISFMNELALLAERVGVDIEHVRLGIGSDSRIGYHFLYAGTGYGGSCFPKDVKALLRTAQSAGQPLRVLDAVERANEAQKQVLVDKIVARFGPRLDGLRFAVWGLAFKPNTDDMREAPSIVVVRALVALGATVTAYDPIAKDAAAAAIGELPGLDFAQDAMEALEGADALVLVTEWKEFKSPDFHRIRALLRQPVVFDGRNLYSPGFVARHGLEYVGVGRRASPSDKQEEMVQP